VETRTSSTAVISESATIGSNCYIGNYAVVGKDCEIGNNTVIYDRAVIVQKCKIGNNCLIEPGVTIGADGFAYERDPETLELERFPHIGIAGVPAKSIKHKVTSDKLFLMAGQQ
jgi:UDP-3-O-[3-hydroxymyristoyl] glucosamine N-acyltransferase